MHHGTTYYQITAAVLPAFLVAVARGGKSRWPATTAALTYMVVLMAMNWVLALVPATPKLAPIYNPVTHLVPPGFPMLLVFPALLVDWLVGGRRIKNDWLLAPALGFGFVAVLVLFQWPFASFLLSLDQPNYLFGSGYWSYAERIGPWAKSFLDTPGYTWAQGTRVGSLDVAAMGQGLAVAGGIAVVTSRIGLWWGRWMTRVKR
jgi:hypothetical protein